MSYIYSSGHIKKEKERLNFNIIFCLIHSVPNITILVCNQGKQLRNVLNSLFFHTKSLEYSVHVTFKVHLSSDGKCSSDVLDLYLEFIKIYG